MTGAIATPPVIRRLDLASGQSPREGFEGVDVWPGAQHIVDLQRYPWPFDDESVLELSCSHYIEHIPMEYVPGVPLTCPTCNGLGRRSPLPAQRDANPFCQDCGGTCTAPAPTRDALFAFFDECWRILVPDGWLHVVVPAHRSDRAFQDPTHRRFITAQTFAYMSEQWRRDTKLDHYNVNCNFVGDCHPVIDSGLQLRYPETAQLKIQKEWNTVIDWTARLQKKPRLLPRPAIGG